VATESPIIELREGRQFQSWNSERMDLPLLVAETADPSGWATFLVNHHHVKGPAARHGGNR